MEKMTSQVKSTKLCKIYDAWKAGHITSAKCDELVSAINKQYYLDNHGEFDLASLA